MRAERIRTAGLCKCQGGSANSNCLACEKIPTTVQLSKPPGLAGSNGQPGLLSDFVPEDGIDGVPGTCRITVRHMDGSHQSYTSKYSLELVSFQVTDENDDGIIEPGEHIYIEQVVVRNLGAIQAYDGQVSMLAGVLLTAPYRRDANTFPNYDTSHNPDNRMDKIL
jgi:hypothetical protein